jgi:hypothetical protein
LDGGCPPPPAAYPGLKWRGQRLVPAWPCSGWGLPCRPLLPGARWSLTPPFHPCLCRLATAIGGLFSAALSIASRRPAVSRHPALWSSDFPRAPHDARDPHSLPDLSKSSLPCPCPYPPPRCEKGGRRHTHDASSAGAKRRGLSEQRVHAAALLARKNAPVRTRT